MAWDDDATPNDDNDNDNDTFHSWERILLVLALATCFVAPLLAVAYLAGKLP